MAAGDEKEVAGKKVPKDRFTNQVCANATGTHKISLMAIGKYANPRCLKNIEKEKLPVIYTSQAKSWMDKTRFIHWYTTVFLPCVKQRIPDPNEMFVLIILCRNCIKTNLNKND